MSFSTARSEYFDLDPEGRPLPAKPQTTRKGVDVFCSLGAEVADPADLPSADEIIKSPYELETDLKVRDSYVGPRREPITADIFTMCRSI